MEPAPERDRFLQKQPSLEQNFKTTALKYRPEKFFGKGKNAAAYNVILNFTQVNWRTLMRRNFEHTLGLSRPI